MTTVRGTGVCADRLKAEGENPDRMVGAFTVAELHAAFDLVRNPLGWKLGIDTRRRLSTRERKAVIEAVAFFAGSPCEIARVGQTGLYHVTAAGYYVCIGA